jgi:hypothetical protein
MQIGGKGTENILLNIVLGKKKFKNTNPKEHNFVFLPLGMH